MSKMPLDNEAHNGQRKHTQLAHTVITCASSALSGQNDFFTSRIGCAHQQLQQAGLVHAGLMVREGPQRS